MGLTEAGATLLYEKLKDLLIDAVKQAAGDRIKGFFNEMKVKRSVERLTQQVTESLDPYFENEHVDEAVQKIVATTCVRSLRPLIDDPRQLLRGSLDAEKLFQLTHPEGRLPTEVSGPEAAQVYTLVTRQVCGLLCEIDGLIEGWERLRWAETYQRLDDLARSVNDVVQQTRRRERNELDRAAELFGKIVQLQQQRSLIELEMTGLRSDTPIACRIDRIFVHPQIVEAGEKQLHAVNVCETEDDAVRTFLRHNGRAVIFGAPGAGKSTWSQWLRTRASLDASPRLVVLVPLRQVSWASPPSLIELARKEAGVHLAESIDASTFNRWLREARVVVLIDGFDEVPEASRDEARRWIEAMVPAVHTCPLVVTARPLSTQHLDTLPMHWTRWDMRGFDETRVRRFLANWFEHVRPGTFTGDLAALANRWGSDPTLGPLTANPLLLTTILVVHELDGELPEGRSELYRRYVEGMLGIWEQRRKVAAITLKLTPVQKLDLLMRLAVDMHALSVERLDEATTTAIVNNHLAAISTFGDDAETVLAHLRERSGLVAGPGHYEFVHKSVMEYLVARAVVQGTIPYGKEGRLDRMTLYRHRHEDRWKTVLFLWAGCAPLKEFELLMRLLAESLLTDDDFRLLGGLLLDQGRRLDRSVQYELVESLLNFDFDPFKMGRPVRWMGNGFERPMDDIELTGLSRWRCDFTDLLWDLLQRKVLENQCPLRLGKPCWHIFFWTSISFAFWSLPWQPEYATNFVLHTPQTPTYDRDLAWAGSRALGSAMKSSVSQSEIARWIREMAKQIPKIKSIFVVTIAHAFAVNGAEARSLSALEAVLATPISPGDLIGARCLVQSARWQVYRPEALWDGDILLTARGHVAALADDSLRERALAALDVLIAHRGSIPAEFLPQDGDEVA